MFSIRTAAIVIAISAASAANAQTAADVARLAEPVGSSVSQAIAPPAQSFAGPDLARLIGAPAQDGTAPHFRVHTAFSGEDLVRLMNQPSVTSASLTDGQVVVTSVSPK